MAKGGDFEIKIRKGGNPIHAELWYCGGRLPEVFNALELRDLAYATKQARIEARQEARRMDRERVKDY